MAKSTGEPTILPILIYLVLAGVVALVLFITSFFVKASVDSKSKLVVATLFLDCFFCFFVCDLYIK